MGCLTAPPSQTSVQDVLKAVSLAGVLPQGRGRFGVNASQKMNKYYGGNNKYDCKGVQQWEGKGVRVLTKVGGALGASPSLPRQTCLLPHLICFEDRAGVFFPYKLKVCGNPA